MSQNSNTSIAVVGINIGKNSFHVVGLDQRGAIVLRQKWSRSQGEARAHRGGIRGATGRSRTNRESAGASAASIRAIRGRLGNDRREGCGTHIGDRGVALLA